MRFEPFSFEKHGSWVKRNIQCVFCEDTRGIMAIREDDTIAGGVILDSWAHNSCQVHLGAETPLVWKHGLHKEVFNYVYNTCDKDVIFGLTPADNAKARKFNAHIGFKEICTVPEAYKPGVDYVAFYLHKDDCKYLER